MARSAGLARRSLVRVARSLVYVVLLLVIFVLGATITGAAIDWLVSLA